jgi:hypothetical protein
MSHFFQGVWLRLSLTVLMTTPLWITNAWGETQSPQPPSDLANEFAQAAKADALPIAPSAPSNLGKELLGNESNPSISLILDTVASYATKKNRIHLGGHTPTTNGFAVTGMEMAASANIDPYFKFDLAMNFAHMHVEEAVLTTLGLPLNLQVRAGQFLSRVGRQNPTHPHTWNFVLHPLPNQFLLGAEGLSAPGVEFSWLLPIPWFAELILAVQHGEAGSLRASEGDPDLRDFIFPLRLVQFFDLSDDHALQIAGNMILGPSTFAPETDNRAYLFGGDFLYRYRPIGAGSTGSRHLTLSGEFWLRDLEVPKDLWRDLGGYVDLTLGFSKRWQAGVRGELWRRLSGDAPTMDNRRTDFGADTQRASLALTFLPSHFSRIRVQYTVEKVEGFPTNHMTFLQLEVSAGAHGAHAY